MTYLIVDTAFHFFDFESYLKEDMSFQHTQKPIDQKNLSASKASGLASNSKAI